MSEQTVENFHEFLSGDGDATEMLAEDCTFFSPVMFRAGQGRLTVEAYLKAARRGFARLPAHGDDESPLGNGFHYTKTVIGTGNAVLEFECEIDGIAVNGVDILTTNEKGEISEVKVMVRPQKAIDKVKDIMAAELRRAPYEIGTAPLEKQTVSVLGKQMAYAEMGEGDPILFLHGNPTSSYLWRNIMPHLADKGRCIAPDLIGMGDSEKLGDSGPGSYRFVDHREYLDALLEEIGVTGNVVLMLHDWGSALGFDWANRHRERIQGIAYTESIVAPMMWDQMAGFMRNVFQGLRSPAGEEMVIENNFFVEQMIPNSVMRELTDAEMDEYRRPFAEGGESRRPTLTWPRELPVEGEPEDVAGIVGAYSRWLAESDIPKLFIDAEPGAVLTGPFREMCRSWPNQTETKVRGIHYVQEDSPREIADALHGFVSKLRG